MVANVSREEDMLSTLESEGLVLVGCFRLCFPLLAMFNDDGLRERRKGKEKERE